MDRFVLTVLISLLPIVAAKLIDAPPPEIQQPPAAPEAQPADLKATLEEVRRKTGIPGLVAAAVRDGRIIAVGACGVREIGTDHEVATDDPFLIGSCTKAMTRLLVARLVDEGVLRFDMPLEEALPGVKMQEAYRTATLSNVLRHNAGLPAYERITPRDTPIIFELRGTPLEQRTRFAEHVLMEVPAAKPGTRFVYSNAGFSVLGNITERRTGKPWEDLMTARVFKPLKMDSAVFGRSPEKTGVPLGHRRTDDGFVVARAGPPLAGVFAPAGAVRLPIRDFARFVAFQADPADAGLLKKDTLAALPGQRAADSGGGGAEGEAIFGGEGTFNAAFAVWPSKKFGIAVCVNGGDADEVCQAAIDAVRQACAPDLASPAGAPQRPRLGIQIRAEDDGTWELASVESGSIADKAGLKAGDRFIEINGKPLEDLDPPARTEALGAQRVSLTVMRDGKRVAVEINRPAEERK